MKRSISRVSLMSIIAAVMLMLTSLSAFAEYDQAKVVAVMRANVTLMGEVAKAASENDWYGAAAALYKLAEGALAIQPYTPPKGTKADWDKTNYAFADAAFRGIGAVGAKDAAALQAAIAELRKLNGQGHGAHK